MSIACLAAGLVIARPAAAEFSFATFVSNMVEWGGHMFFPKHAKGGPATAGQLGDASVELPGTKVIDQSEAKIGDVVANKRPDFTNATGHSGIYAGDVTIITPRGTYQPPIGEMGQIHASDKQVVRRSFEDMRSQKHVNPVFRRIFIQK